MLFRVGGTRFLKTGTRQKKRRTPPTTHKEDFWRTKNLSYISISLIKEAEMRATPPNGGTNKSSVKRRFGEDDRKKEEEGKEEEEDL